MGYCVYCHELAALKRGIDPTCYAALPSEEICVSYITWDQSCICLSLWTSQNSCMSSIGTHQHNKTFLIYWSGHGPRPYIKVYVITLRNEVSNSQEPSSEVWFLYYSGHSIPSQVLFLGRWILFKIKVLESSWSRPFICGNCRRCTYCTSNTK